MSAELILAGYRVIARPFLDKLFQPNTCIEQSRVLLEVLKRFGIQAEAIGVKFIVICKERDYQFVSGLDPEDRERGRKIAKAYIERGEPNGLRHVVLLVERRILVDSTLYQASAPPEFSFTLDPDVAIVPLPHAIPEGELPDLRVEYTCDNGVTFTARWMGTWDREWEQDDGWEPSHLWPLIDRIEQDLRILVNL